MNRRDFLASGSAIAALSTFTIPVFAGSISGTFSGASGHATKGTVTVEDGNIVLEDDFSLDGAPDPRVALGKAGKFVSGTDFAILKQNAGKQKYAIPANLRDSGFDTVVIWCRKYSVPLGQAALN